MNFSNEFFDKNKSLESIRSILIQSLRSTKSLKRFRIFIPYLEKMYTDSISLSIFKLINTSKGKLTIDGITHWSETAFQDSSEVTKQIIRDTFSSGEHKSDEDFDRSFQYISNEIITFLKEQIDLDPSVRTHSDRLQRYAKLPKFIATNKFSDSRLFQEYSLFELSELKLEDLTNGDKIESRFALINQSSPVGGYFRNQLVVVTAPPGGGKSLFLMNEAVYMASQGHKILYTALGDLTRIDLLTRMISIILQIPINKIFQDLSFYREQAIEKNPLVFQNIKIQFMPSGEFSVEEFVDLLNEDFIIEEDHSITRHEYFDVFMIDYDSNFYSRNNLYEKGDEVYQKLKGLTIGYESKGIYDKLVIVASQCKYDGVKFGTTSLDAGVPKEYPTLNILAESSRKGQHVDLALYLQDLSEGNINNFGRLCLLKNRRGSLGHSFFQRTDFGTLPKLDEVQLIKLGMSPREKMLGYL